MLGAQNRYSQLVEIESKIEKFYSDVKFDQAEAQIFVRNYMSGHGIDFEGKDLPLSMRPLLMSETDVTETSCHLSRVRSVMNRLIDRARRDIRQGRDSVLTRFFSGYGKWFDMIAAENRAHDHVMLMRFDTVLDPTDGWQAMEPNAACPGGVIHCGYLRNAWLESDLGQKIAGDLSLVERAADDPSGFIDFLAEVIDVPDGQPHAVICNYDGTYSNELSSLVRRAAQDRAAGKTNLTISTADISDIETRGSEVYLDGSRVDLIYNKLDPLQIDPLDPAYEGWRAASRSASCEFLNSIGAMYIGEAKSVFAALYDPEIRDYLALSAMEQLAIETVVLPTFRIRDLENQGAGVLLKKDPASWVLKEDATTRGVGVIMGENETPENWCQLLREYARRGGVVQRAVQTPKRTRVCQKNSGQEKEEFYGADWFFYGDTFAGCVSRAHIDKVFNVGNGGHEVPTLVLRKSQWMRAAE